MCQKLIHLLLDTAGALENLQMRKARVLWQSPHQKLLEQADAEDGKGHDCKIEYSFFEW